MNSLLISASRSTPPQKPDGILKILHIVDEFYQRSLDDHIWVFILLIVIFLDIALGFMKAWANDDFSSKKARQGVVSHAFIFVVVAIIYPFTSFMGFEGVANTFIFYLLLSYTSSILSNLRVLGFEIPYIDKYVASKLDVYKYNDKKSKELELIEKQQEILNDVKKKIDKDMQKKGKNKSGRGEQP